MERKVWGTKYILRQDSTHSTALLRLEQNWRCSWHYHNQKYNLFFVVSGIVRIVTQEIDNSFKETLLKENESLIVPPNQYHEFQVVQDSVMIEEMFVEYDGQDIIRDNHGGRL